MKKKKKKKKTKINYFPYNKIVYFSIFFFHFGDNTRTNIDYEITSD